jgi:multisubunit Na+/H+ antiporter MnhB subunit
MISAYNQSQIIRGVLCVLGSLVCYALAWLFFRYASSWVLDSFRFSTNWAVWIAVAALIGITISGYITWQRGQGFQSYVETSLFHDLAGSADTAGANVVDYYARRVTGPAYVLSQVFLGGPLLLLRGMRHFQQLIPNEAVLEQKLHHILGILRKANKWQSITEYPEERREILMLAQLKQIDFSAHKGTPRFKALPPDGV